MNEMPQKKFMIVSATYVFVGTVIGFVSGMYVGAVHPLMGFEREVSIVACMPDDEDEGIEKAR